MNAGVCHFLRNGREFAEICCSDLNVMGSEEFSESGTDDIVRFDIGHFFSYIVSAEDVELLCYFVVTISVACCFSTVHIRKFLIVCKNNI